METVADMMKRAAELVAEGHKLLAAAKATPSAHGTLDSLNAALRKARDAAQVYRDLVVAHGATMTHGERVALVDARAKGRRLQALVAERLS
jgi:IS5 family transposase